MLAPFAIKDTKTFCAQQRPRYMFEKTSSKTNRQHAKFKVGASLEDVLAYFYDRNLPGDDITLNLLAQEVLQTDIVQGFLTISNAMQWRLQYQRIISLGNSVEGVGNYDYNA
jgi:hypothetical protein